MNNIDTSTVTSICCFFKSGILILGVSPKRTIGYKSCPNRDKGKSSENIGGQYIELSPGPDTKPERN